MTTAPIPTQIPSGGGSLAALPAHLETTPGRLRAFAVVLGLFSFLLWFVAQGSLTTTWQAVQTIGKDTVPSIVAAEHIRAYLADMDANAANGYFSRGTAAAKKQYEADRQQVTDALISAAQNITYGEEERKPIRAMNDALQQYVGLVEVARFKGYPAGLPTLVEASDLMHNTLLPAAIALDATNFKYLNATYDASRANAAGLRLKIVAMSGFMLLVLLAAQWYLLRKTRRLLNIPLVAATLLLLIFAVKMVSVLTQEDALLRRAKKDCFDSIHALWMARAVAYDANGDESLYLLWREQRERYTQQFRQKSALLADTPLDAQVVSAAQTQLPQWKGYLGDELRNITFEGEQAAALEMLQTYAVYMDMDAKIRTLEESGQHEEAVTFCTGTNPGQSNWGFDRFNTALGKVLDINEKEFAVTVDNAFGGLKWMPFAAPVFALLIAVLSWLGLHQRIREYYV